MIDWTIALLIAVVVALIAAVAGFYLGRERAGGAARISALEAELAAAREEQDRLRGDVGEHFDTTAQLFDKLTQSYRELYQHLAEGSERLGGETLPAEPNEIRLLQRPDYDDEESPFQQREQALKAEAEAAAGLESQSLEQEGGKGVPVEPRGYGAHRDESRGG